MELNKRRLMTTSERVDVLEQYIKYCWDKFTDKPITYIKSLDQFIQEGYVPTFRDEGIK